MTFTYFLCLLVLVRTSSTMLNRSDESGHRSSFYLMKKEKLSIFHCWVQCSLRACDIWSFIMLWYVLILPTLLSFYQKWLLNFIKCFSFIYWQDSMIFIFYFVNVVYFIDWFVNIELSLHPWNKSNLITVYDPFNYYWIWFVNILLKIFHLCS